MSVTLYQIADADALRGLLDTLNDAGADYRVSGVDGDGEPFLAFLSGAYADGCDAFTFNPWDREIDAPTPPACGECNGYEPLSIEALSYPLVAFSAHHVILES